MLKKIFGSKSSVDDTGETHLNIKAIFFGTGDSGKTTIVNHLKLLDSDEIMEKEIDIYKQRIYENVISITFETFEYFSEKKLISNPENIEQGDTFFDLLKSKPDSLFTKTEIPDFIFSFWKEPEVYKYLDEIIKQSHLSYNQENLVKKFLSLESDFGEFKKHRENIIKQNTDLQIKTKDSTKYVQLKTIPNISDFFIDSFIISSQDVLSTRGKTTGLVQSSITTIKDGLEIILTMYDVGSQRNERKKWINCLQEQLDIFVFCVSLSEYDQLCYEDDETNRLEESLHLLEELIDPGRGYDKYITDLTIVFTKFDIFQKKIKKYGNLKEYFNDFDGDSNSVNDAKEFIQMKFFDVLKRYAKDYETITVNVMDANDAKKLKKMIENHF
eukprot:gene6253-10261_t